MIHYDAQSDELTIHFADEPIPAVTEPLDDGVFLRRHVSSGLLVGLVIRDFSVFARLYSPSEESDELARNATRERIERAT